MACFVKLILFLIKLIERKKVLDYSKNLQPKVMINNIFKKLWKTEGQEGIQTPLNLIISFTLVYKELTIGFLKLENGVWSYEYSEDFKKQNEILPLTDFPDVNKKYKSQELLPYFNQRIPSLNQPKVKAVLKKEKIDETNEVELLKRFGKTSITNPFQLEATF